MHWKGEAANLLAGWLGGQRGLSRQSTAVLNENRKWFTSLMLQPSARLPTRLRFAQPVYSALFIRRRKLWPREEKKTKKKTASHSPKNCSNETRILSVPTSLTSTQSCISRFVLPHYRLSIAAQSALNRLGTGKTYGPFCCDHGPPRVAFIAL